MDAAEARALVLKSLPRFAPAGLPALSDDDVKDVKFRRTASLWAGMGAIYELNITAASGQRVPMVVKRVDLPARCDNIGDQRKKDSYDVEAAFYSQGHAERLIKNGCCVPFPLHVEKSATGNVIICMTKLEDGGARGASEEAFVRFLARLHATYWGARADEACAPAPGGGLQQQGCYWYLDTRPNEHRKMGSSGWMGRLRLAARAIDLRLKADPLQSVCHGDAKGANIMYQSGAGPLPTPLVYDFQYCGKACVAKDLAYFLNVEVCGSASQEQQLLEAYLSELSGCLEAQGIAPPSMQQLSVALELALCDWRRFTEIGLGGWGDSSATRRVQAVLDRLDGGKALASEQAYVEAMQSAFPV